MGMFKKKPVVIEARQLGNDYDEDLRTMDWCGGVLPGLGEDMPEDGLFYIDTLEGVMLARAGDYIIKGVWGEFYPCKPDIFEAIYEAVGH